MSISAHKATDVAALWLQVKGGGSASAEASAAAKAVAEAVAKVSLVMHL